MVCEAIRSETCLTRIPELTKVILGGGSENPTVKKSTNAKRFVIASNSQYTRSFEHTTAEDEVLRWCVLVGIWSWDWLLA